MDKKDMVLPADILAAIENEQTLTVDQLRRMIETEAGWIDLTFEQAVAKHKKRELPHTPIGADISMLLEMYLIGK